MAQLELLIRQVETDLWTGGLLSSSASAVAMRHSIISSRPFNDGHGLETLTPTQLRLRKELQPGHQLRLCAHSRVDALNTGSLPVQHCADHRCILEERQLFY
jgi:hypothetical protein